MIKMSSLISLLALSFNRKEIFNTDSDDIKSKPLVKCHHNCHHLIPKEINQTKKKEHHECTKYNEVVYHYNRHPHIFRCQQCVEDKLHRCNECYWYDHDDICMHEDKDEPIVSWSQIVCEDFDKRKDK